MIDSLHHLIGLLFFDIPSLHYVVLLYEPFFNLTLSIIFCLSSGDIYFSLSISSFVSKLFCSEVFENLVILSAILFSINHQLLLLFFE